MNIPRRTRFLHFRFAAGTATAVLFWIHLGLRAGSRQATGRYITYNAAMFPHGKPVQRNDRFF
jgi:hypothetical protein